MFLFITLLVILIVLGLVMAFTIGVFGAGTILIFGDVIICAYLIAKIMKRIIFGKDKKEKEEK